MSAPEGPGAPAGEPGQATVSPGLKLVAVLVGLVILAGLVVMAVAGLPGAVAILLTFVGLLAMVALGSLLGGRNTPARAPVAVDDPQPRGEADGPGDPAAGGTMER